MIKKNGHPSGTQRSYSLADHARALSIILREEFEESFVFQDAATGALVDANNEGKTQNGLSPTDVTGLISEGKAVVTSVGQGRCRLTLPLYGGGQLILTATAVISHLAQGEADSVKERRRLEKWAQSVSERLRCSDYILSRNNSEDERQQTKNAWEVILTLDHLLRNLRVHHNTTANTQRILRAAFSLVGVETLAWVPKELSEPVLLQGQAFLSTEDCRQIAGFLSRHQDFRAPGPLMIQDVAGLSWGGRFSGIVNLMAFVVSDRTPVGWTIAFNKKSPKNAAGVTEYTAFRKGDAALLTPFLGLLELQTRTADRYRDLKDLLVGLTRSLTSTLDAKDGYTYGHSERVARVAVELGRELGMGEDELGNIYLAGLLHDIGKIGVSDAVLGKAGRLTPEEFEHIKQHVTIGHSILAELHQIRELLPGVLYHHEQYDGSGYPEGLAGEAIPFLARILAVADAYDAMSTTRPYRASMPIQRVEEILLQGAGKQWDKRVVDAFMRCRQSIYAIRQRGVGESLRHALDGALRKTDSYASVAAGLVPFEFTQG